MNIKKVIYLIIVTVTLFGLIGCSGGTTKVGWVGSIYPGYWSASFRSFSGTDYKSISLLEGELLVIYYESEIESGTFEILISDPDKLEVTTIDINDKGEKEIVVQKNGEYRILLKADKAKGNFKLEW